MLVWGQQRKAPDIEGKRYTTEDKIRILGEADRGEKSIQEHGAPEFLRSDNGSEFIAKIVQRWLKENGVKTIYIEPGKSLAERVFGEFSRTFPG